MSPFKPKPISLAPPVPPRAPIVRSPTISSSIIPETIQELPIQEDEAMISTMTMHGYKNQARNKDETLKTAGGEESPFVLSR